MDPVPPITGIDDPAQARVLLYQAGRPVHAPLDRVGLATNADVQAGLTAETRNRVINSACQISQENGNTVSAIAATGAYFAADQWALQWSTTGAAIDARRDQAGFVAPSGSASVLFNCTTPGTFPAAGYMFFGQKIEGKRIVDLLWGTANAKSIIVRFWFRGKTGLHSLFIRNAALNRSYLVPFSVTDDSVWKEYTFVVPGDVTGTWLTDTNAAMDIGISLGAGSTFIGVAGWQAGNFSAVAGQLNGAGVVGVQPCLSDVGLYLDPLATGIAPPWVMPDEAEELRACQRYWYKATGIESMFSGDVTTSGSYYAAGAPPVTMRVSPTITGVNANAAAFPATTGSLIAGVNYYRENRVANATAAGFFYSVLTLNARM